MGWIRTHWAAARRCAIGVGLVGITVFLWISVNLYRQRKAAEEMIAARDHSAMMETGDASLFEGKDIRYNGKTYRRNSYVKAILCMGVDRSDPMTGTTTSGFGGQADGVFLLAQDTARNTLKILMIPRDTMTEITLTDLSGNVLGKDVQHLTLAYAYGDGREKSCRYMVDAVSGLLGGLAIDHYMAANIEVISVLNDAVGGVAVTVPIDGMEQKDPAFVKGPIMVLRGKQAEDYVRYRDVQEDHSALYRMDRHEEYITRFFQAVQERSASDSQTVTELFGQVQDYLVTDMGKEQYLKVAMDALERGSLTEDDFYTVPGTGVTTARYDEFYADKEMLIPVILKMFYREVG